MLNGTKNSKLFFILFFWGGGGYLKFRYYQPTFQQHLEAVVSGTCTAATIWMSC